MRQSQTRVVTVSDLLHDLTFDSTTQGARHHVYCIHFGQQTDPMDNGQPPWAADEFGIYKVYFWKVNWTNYYYYTKVYSLTLA